MLYHPPCLLEDDYVTKIQDPLKSFDEKSLFDDFVAWGDEYYDAPIEETYGDEYDILVYGKNTLDKVAHTFDIPILFSSSLNYAFRGEMCLY